MLLFWVLPIDWSSLSVHERLLWQCVFVKIQLLKSTYVIQEFIHKSYKIAGQVLQENNTPKINLTRKFWSNVPFGW